MSIAFLGRPIESQIIKDRQGRSSNFMTSHLPTLHRKNHPQCEDRIRHVIDHLDTHHLQAEIKRLIADYQKSGTASSNLRVNKTNVKVLS